MSCCTALASLSPVWWTAEWRRCGEDGGRLRLSLTVEMGSLCRYIRGIEVPVGGGSYCTCRLSPSSCTRGHGSGTSPCFGTGQDKRAARCPRRRRRDGCGSARHCAARAYVGRYVVGYVYLDSLQAGRRCAVGRGPAGGHLPSKRPRAGGVTGTRAASPRTVQATCLASPPLDSSQWLYPERSTNGGNSGEQGRGREISDALPDDSVLAFAQ